MQNAKRKVKVEDTNYVLSNYGDLFSRADEAIKSLGIIDESPKRYEDKTEEEISHDMNRKRKQQFGKLVKFRTYQIGGMCFAIVFYLFFYRRFLHPKSVYGSLVYN
jgi:hypothetical protein